MNQVSALGAIEHPLFGPRLVVPPNNMQAEQALLGALLANSAKAFDMVSEFLQPHHFYDPVHSAVYAAIARRASMGLIADAVTLRSEFENNPILDEVGGTAYLARLLSAMVGVINAKDYARVVHDAWVRRQLIDACIELVDRSYAPDSGESGQDLIERLDGLLTGIVDGAGDVRPLVSAGDAVSHALALSYAARERESPLAGVTTGYDAINRMTGGLMPGCIYLLGARPAMGKTSLGVGVAAGAASTGLSVLLWSGEMSAPQIGTRMAAAHANLEVASVFRGKGWVEPAEAGGKPDFRKLDAQEWDRLVRAEREAAKLPLQIDDRPGITVSALRSRARRMKRSKAGLDLLVIDYVALMRASPQAERLGQYERMTELSHQLQQLAVELHVPLLVLCQLNRANESRENKMPQLSDLRDSGALEQDAYCVMFLHRPYYYLLQQGEPAQGPKEKDEDFAERSARWHRDVVLTKDLAVVQVAKNRNGPTGPCRLRFDDLTIWFRDEGHDGAGPAWGGNLPGGNE